MPAVPIPSLRRATAADANEVARLRWQFTAELGHPTENLEAFRPTFATTWRRLTDGGPLLAWVAEVDGALIGIVCLETVAKIPRPNPRSRAFGYVTNVYVEPAWRGRGIGERLMQVLIEESRALGHGMLVLWPSERSAEFYARLGFRPSTDALELHFEGPP